MTAYADYAVIDIQSGIKHLDNSSQCNLPYYFIDVNSDMETIVVDSLHFINPRYISNNVYTFSGNMPLSSQNVPKPPVQFKGNISTEYMYPGNGTMIKVFPYESSASGIIRYSSVEVFYNANAMPEPPAQSNYDYMIICTAPYDTAFSRFQDWKIRMGYRTELFTVEHIDSISTGADLQERIRNFIKEQYALNNFRFLLLAGDSTMIPARKMFAMECGAGFYADEDSIPADLYYSALGGNFNYDNDNTYGEIEDSCDLYGDIYIGRMLFESTAFGPTPVIDRTISYESTGEISHLGRGMFLGMILWNPPYTPGGLAKEMIHNDIIPDDYHIKTFYEYQGHFGDADIIDSINMGYGIINHDGHGSYKGVWVDSMTAISTWDALGLTNGFKTGLFYSIGCWVGAFDRANDLRNFSLCLQAASNGGAVSIITNSRYGWGAPGYPGWGVSDILDYQFFKMLFESEDTRAGVLLSNLKDKYAPYSNYENLYRWHLYQLNLFGDPSLAIHTKIPDSMHIDQFINGSIIEIRVTDTYGMPIEHARIALSADTVLDLAYTDNSGYALLNGIYSDTCYISAAKTNYITILDSFVPDSTIEKHVYLITDNFYAGVNQNIRIVNSMSSSSNINIHSLYLDSSFTLSGRDTLNLPYWPLAVHYDTVTVSYPAQTDTYILNIDNIPLFIDSIDYSGDMFNARIVNPLSLQSSQCSLVLSSGLGDDTFILSGIDSFLYMHLTAHPSLQTAYAALSLAIFNNGNLIGSDTVYCSNTNSVFNDNFTQGMGNWLYGTANWIIVNDSLLHCGDGNNYFNNMNDTIISDSFIVVPGTVCSMDIEFEFPSLETDSAGSFIYDIDGMFVKLISGMDTSIIDFVSSGGALTKSINFGGWKVYELECDSPQFAKLMLHFISDRDVVMPGVFINSIFIKPLYMFTSPDTGMPDDRDYFIYRITPMISSGSVTYMINRVDGEMNMAIYSIDGRELMSEGIESNGEQTCNLDNMPSGVYFVKFKGNGRIYSDKIILIR